MAERRDSKFVFLTDMLFGVNDATERSTKHSMECSLEQSLDAHGLWLNLETGRSRSSTEHSIAAGGSAALIAGVDTADAETARAEGDEAVLT